MATSTNKTAAFGVKLIHKCMSKHRYIQKNRLFGALYGLVESFFKNDEGHNVTVNGDRYRAMITNFFIPELNNPDVQELWFQQDGATCHTARATIDLLKDTFGDRLISRFGPVNWPPKSCDLTPLDYFLWGYVKSLVYADKPQTLDHLEDNIRRVIADIRPQMLEKSSKIGRPDWTTSEPAVAVICQKSYLKCLSPTNRKSELDSTLGESAPSFTTVKYWAAESKRGRTSCKDERRSGRPNERTTPEMVKKIHKAILDVRRLKVCELADIVGISKSAVHCILFENLDMRKLCARWVLRLLTLQQKQCREDVLIECLAKFHSYKAEFWRRFITMDETWVHLLTPETKKQSKQWIEMGEPAPKKAKTVPAAGKVMASVFWDARGKIFIYYIKKKKNYQRKILRELIATFERRNEAKTVHLDKKVLSHEENAPAHKSVILQ
ncbi:mariner transposase [Trichonephila clavipes]|nr:mariner transposase [Trichonephila clavipes]